MLGSIIRIILFIAVVAGAIWGVTMLLETPGRVALSFAGYEYTLTPIAFVAAVFLAFIGMWLLLKVLGLVLAVFQFLSGDETAFSRYMDRTRERRGMEALSRAMSALAAGDGRNAMARAVKAEKLLHRPELTRLVVAQAAELIGDRDRALATYKAMAEEPLTAVAGTKGLLKLALDAGETERALNLAEHCHRLNPADPTVLETLYDLRSQRFDWAGARKILQLMRKGTLVTRAEADRREAMLALAQAEDADQAGETETARKLALEAAKLDPENTEAVLAAARHLTRSGAGRTASRYLTDAWKVRPDARIGAAFAEIEPSETIDNRLRRFQRLFEANPTHAETHYLRAELALAAGDWSGARAAMQQLTETEPSARTCAIMAAIARGEGQPEAVVRAWLARALGAPRDEGLDSQLGHAAMLPILIGADPAPGANARRDRAEEEVQDAEEPAPRPAPEPDRRPRPAPERAGEAVNPVARPDMATAEDPTPAPAAEDPAENRRDTA